MNKQRKGKVIITSTLLTLSVCMCCVIIYFYATNGGHTVKRVPVPNVTHDGIDVSHHQRNLDWELLGKDPNIKFAYIKATEGTTWHDPYFEHNVKEARKHGIKVGAYHLLSLTTSPETQVENFCRIVGRNKTDLIPAIDIEARLMKHKNRDRLKRYALRVSELLAERFGRKPLIYTSTGVYNNYLYPQFENHYLWIASYSRRCPQLRGNTHVNIWQYSESRKIPNYNKTIDLNCFVNGMTVEKLEL